MSTQEKDYIPDSFADALKKAEEAGQPVTLEELEGPQASPDPSFTVPVMTVDSLFDYLRSAGVDRVTFHLRDSN